MTNKQIAVLLTVEELDALRTSAISMHSALSRDKFADKTEIEFWYEIQDKLMMAKIRQTPERS